ncbi:hypothetical protein ACIBH1_24655 [Nonomuraea sp. NPDC050663]|uniref:hypothetical protein n=1 Tax=Nonomuraea sp. NPDC050663 TaxID=3364370 RepID=UPI00379D4E01
MKARFALLMTLVLGSALLLQAPAQAAATTKVFGFLHASSQGRLWFAKGKLWPHPEYEAWQWKRTGKWKRYPVAGGAKLYVNILAGQAHHKRVSYSWLNGHLKPASTKDLGFHVWFHKGKIVKVKQVYTP